MKLRLFLLGLVLVTLLAAFAQNGRGRDAAAPGPPAPVLVELFTSEGCSDCPPADALLTRLEREQPVAGARVIALSEHVTYWDHDGWKDPFSDEVYTRRQQAYAAQFGLSSVYTPQMVVDGAQEFVGSDAGRAQRAISDSARGSKFALRISGLRRESGSLVFTLAAAAPVRGAAEVYAVLAVDEASSRVSAGENSGHTLRYTAIARQVREIGAVDAGQPVHREVRLPLGDLAAVPGLRLVVFAQQPEAGPVLGATMQELGPAGK